MLGAFLDGEMVGMAALPLSKSSRRGTEETRVFTYARVAVAKASGGRCSKLLARIRSYQGLRTGFPDRPCVDWKRPRTFTFRSASSSKQSETRRLKVDDRYFDDEHMVLQLD